MLKSFARTARAAVTLTVSAFAGAASAEDAKVKEMSFAIRVPFKSDITVTSSDGQRWDTILPQTVPIWADIVVDTRHPGFVDRAAIYLGTCSKTGCGSNPRLAYWDKETRDWRFHGKFEFDTGRIPVSTAGIATINVGDAALNACNGELQSEGAATGGISVNIPVTATLSVNTRKRVGASLTPQEPNRPPIPGTRPSMAATSARRPPSS